MNASPLHRFAAVAATLVALAMATPAQAAVVPSDPAASADAYGLLVDVQLLPTHTPVRQGPLSRATQDFPPGAADPAEANVLEAGPLPADSSIVDHVGVMTSLAGANGLPNAVASASVADVALLGAGENAMVTAKAVVAQSSTSCTGEPNATGTTFEDIRVNGTVLPDQTPAPNTVIDLTVAKVILNEQVKANDGRGIVVNAIHVVSTTEGDPLFRGDVIVAHAMSTVSCTNGAGSTGGDTVVKMVKDATPTTATAGTEVTYSAHVTNSSTEACLVNEFVEHLSPAFEFVSTAGDFGDALDRTLDRPGGGVDLILGNGKTLAAGETFDQTFTVKVKDGTAPGVYYNNLEILCANLGDFVKGLDAPVRVTDEPTASPTPSLHVDPANPPECSDTRDNDADAKIDYPADPGCASPQDDDERDDNGEHPHTGGNDSLFVLGGVALLGLAVVTRRARGLLHP
jgi:hypothetical protein